MRMLFSICFFAIFNFVASDDVCKCRNPTYESSWGDFTPTSICIGKCNGIQRGKRDCYASQGGVVVPKMRCQVERRCVNPETCEGSWSPWSNLGSCTAACKQLQSRYCYKKGSTFQIRNNYCEGSNGTSEQNRRTLCSHGDCDPRNLPGNMPPTTAPRLRMKPSTRSTTTKSTTREATTVREAAATDFTFGLITNDSFTTAIERKDIKETTDGGSGELVSEGDPLPPRDIVDDVKPESGFNTVLLAAILGSVGLVCVAVVVLGLAMVVTKKRKNKTMSALTSRNIDTIHNFKNASYETVGPALPDRPAYQSTPSPKKIDPIIYENTPTKEKRSGKQCGSGDSDHYLLPFRYPSSKRLSVDEAIYCNIDESKR